MFVFTRHAVLKNNVYSYVELDLRGQSNFMKDFYVIKTLRGEYVNVSAKLKVKI